MKQALIVFAKVPRPGAVKTRLTPPLTSAEGATLYEAFLQDALDSYNEITPDVRLYLGGTVYPSETYPYLANHSLQRGDGLGERMYNAFEEVFDVGYDQLCIVGTDHPTLPLRYIRDAFDALGSHDMVIGPSKDGGYYLLGMRTLSRVPFEEMTYSHDSVFRDTMTNLEAGNLSTFVLPEWYDVDDEASLVALVNDLRDKSDGCIRTRKVLADLQHQYGQYFQSV